MPTTTYPPGSVIAARRRLWRVDAQTGPVLTATTIDSGLPTQSRFYLPMEPVEPGQLPRPATDVVGSHFAQQLLLRACRLSMLHGTAPLLSLQRSRVIPKDYQLVPVVMALELPRVRMLLADDVGLGKTIEAGLILTELLARQMAQRVLVIVPANLREQWREALDHFFHLAARIISSRRRRQMERELPAGANPWASYPCLITSVDYAKQPAIRNQILEQAWDVVLFDEAHQVARPHQSGPNQRMNKDRWQLATSLSTSPRVRHLLLLTATPHNGYSDSFASLLELLEVDAVQGPAHQPRIARAVAARHVCQRRREDVTQWFADSPDRNPFPERDQHEVVVPLTDHLGQAIRAVEAYGDQVLANAASGSAQTRTLAHWTVLHLHKRALSSPEALRCSLRNRRRGLLARLEGQRDDMEDAGLDAETARANVMDEDTGERLSEEDAGQRAERVVVGSAQAIRAEVAQLKHLEKLAQSVTPRRDSKLQKLLDVPLREFLARDPKAIVFTRYVDTMHYVADQIQADRRYADVEVLRIWGDLNERQRQEVFLAFERAPKAVLVATDAISEGINLQHAACQVIHYELPWNPNRLEQRNGRVDRFGQRQPVVYIRTLVMDDTLDAAILKVLVEKAQRIRQDYGFAPPYFGDETDILDLLRDYDISLGGRQLDLFDWSPNLATPHERIQDPFAAETLERIKGESFYGQTHIALPEIERRLRETQETIGSPQEIRDFVISGLRQFGCDAIAQDDGAWRLRINNPILQTASVGEWIEMATFDAEYALDHPEADVLDVAHPLVRRLIEEVKQQAFRNDGRDALSYGRTAPLISPEAWEVTAVLHLLARYVVRTAPTSTIEELLPVAVTVYGAQALPEAEARRLAQAEPAPGARAPEEVAEALAEVDAIPELETMLEHAVDARRQALIAERRQMQRSMLDAGAPADTPWLQGLDDLTPGSYDVLAITICYPE